MMRENPGQITARVQKWLAEILRAKRTGGVSKVSREVARARARICRSCPMQQSFSGVCNSCSNQRKATRQIIMGNEPVADQTLRACGVLGIDTQIGVHLNLGKDAVEGLPVPCWRRDGP